MTVKPVRPGVYHVVLCDGDCYTVSRNGRDWVAMNRFESVTRPTKRGLINGYLQDLDIRARVAQARNALGVAA